MKTRVNTLVRNARAFEASQQDKIKRLSAKSRTIISDILTRSQEAKAEIETLVNSQKQTVRRYIDGFNRLDEAQIRSCLSDRIRWTLLGHFQVAGARDDFAAIVPPPNCKGPPRITIRRMVEEGDIIMAELLSEVDRLDGSVMRLAICETYVFEDGLIHERRAFPVPLVENDFK